MPRPRKNPDELLTRELRITPPNGVEIVDWCLNDSIRKFVAFKEGGDETGKKLHYHCYIETTMTSQALPKWIYTVCGCIETGEKGNAVFFSRAAHDHTFGYIAKNRCVAIRYNYDQTVLEEWFTQSDEYKRQREKERKRDHRTRSHELDEIIKEVERQLEHDVGLRTVEGCISQVLEQCVRHDVKFPARSQMEHMVNKMIYKYNDYIVMKYYLRGFGQI